MMPKPVDSNDFNNQVKENSLDVDSEGGVLVLPKPELVLKVLKEN